MRNTFLFLLLLLAANAYSQSTRLPKPKTTATAPASSATRPSSTRQTIRTEDRPTSTKLPENRSAQVAPQPAPAPAPPPTPGVRRAPIRRSRPAQYNGGLAYEKGDNLLQIGVGLSSYYYGNPFGITYEHGVSDDISFGGQLDYNSSTYGGYRYYGYSYNYSYGYTATYFGLRASYHANRLLNINSNKFDLYAGLGLGYISFRWRDDDYYYSDIDYNSRLFFNYFIGGKYYFSNHVGAFMELGYTGLSAARIGLAAKF